MAQDQTTQDVVWSSIHQADKNPSLILLILFRGVPKWWKRYNPTYMYLAMWVWNWYFFKKSSPGYVIRKFFFIPSNFSLVYVHASVPPSGFVLISTYIFRIDFKKTNDWHNRSPKKVYRIAICKFHSRRSMVKTMRTRQIVARQQPADIVQ